MLQWSKPVSKQFKPHLACDADLDKITYPIMVFNKLDGVRMLNVGGNAVGRSLKKFKNKKLTAFYSADVLTGLDGELCFGDITSESLCRDTTSVVNTIESEDVPDLYAFDYVPEEYVDIPYILRYKQLQASVDAWNEFYGFPSIHIIPYTMAYSKGEVEALYAAALEAGYEGVVLRDPTAFHKSGRCTANEGAYIRLKPSADAEAIVLRLEEAEENLNEAVINELGHTERSSHKANKVGKGMVGTLICKDMVSGLEIRVGAGKMSHEERTFYWLHPEKIVDSVIKYRSLMTGVKDAPRHARFIGFRALEDISE